jgi:hypothetical protein
MDVAVYNERIMGPAHVQNVVELACRMALAYRGVAHVTMPADMQSEPIKKDTRSKRTVPDHVSNLLATGAHIPGAEQVAHEPLRELNNGHVRLPAGPAEGKQVRGRFVALRNSSPAFVAYQAVEVSRTPSRKIKASQPYEVY